MVNYKSQAIVKQEAILSSDFTSTANATLTDVTGLVLTLPNNAGKSLIIVNLTVSNDTIARVIRFLIDDGGTNQEYNGTGTAVASRSYNLSFCYIAENNGQTIQLEFISDGAGTTTVSGTVAAGQSNISSMELTR